MSRIIRNKIDLHLHIDGSVRPETVYEIARLENIEPECNMTLEEIAKEMVIQPGTFDPDFLTFNPPIRAMQSRYGIQRVTEELIDTLAKENVKYAELRYAPQYHLEKGLTQRDAIEAACEGLKNGLARNPGIHCGLIVCCMDIGKAVDNRELNFETIDLAKQYLDQGVCAIDLAGYESDLSNFKELFDYAKELGIPATCHSEFTVKEAVVFETSRIGHGYQFAESEEYISLAKQYDVTLEMCPVSSVKYDYGLTIDETHPLRRLFLEGVKVTVNTDNKTVLNTDLELEYDCMRKMGFTDDEIEQVNVNAIKAAFTTEEIKKELIALTK